MLRAALADVLQCRMPFGTHTRVAVASTLTVGVWTALRAVPTPVTGGFDTLDVIWICDFKGTVKTPQQIAADFPLGMRYGSLDFWLRQARPTCVGGNVWTVEARYEGRISTAKPAHITITGATASEGLTIQGPGAGITTTHSAAWLPFSISLTGSASISLAIRENVPSFEYSYVHVGTDPVPPSEDPTDPPALPRTHLVGAGELSGSPRITPPVDMGVRTFPWDDFTSTSWRLNIPGGWVFENLRSDRIAGAEEEVHYCTEVWTYTPLYKPQL